MFDWELEGAPDYDRKKEEFSGPDNKLNFLYNKPENSYFPVPILAAHGAQGWEIPIRTEYFRYAKHSGAVGSAFPPPLPLNPTTHRRHPSSAALNSSAISLHSFAFHF